MRQPPSLRDIHRYPIVGGTALLAIGATLAWWAKLDISPLFESSLIRRGEFWRLLTSVLPHGGIFHLLFNVYWVWAFGTIVEETYGHLKTACLFLLFAIVPNALEFAFADGGIGLSGIGYGLFGLLWILSKYDQRFADAIDGKTVQLFVVWFFICIATTVTNIMPIANIAHGVGAIVGILTGFAISRRDLRISSSAAIAALLMFGLWSATLGRPFINLSKQSGYDEARWGFEALNDNHPQEAVRWFSEAIRYRPNEPTFWYDLAIAQQELKNFPAAIADYQKAADLGSADAQYEIGRMYENGIDGLPKDSGQANQWYLRAAANDHLEALNAVAWNYATNKDPGIYNPKLALQYAERMIRPEKDDPNPNHLDTLAEAYFVNGRYCDASEAEQKAIALASSEDRPGFEKSLLRIRETLKQRPPTEQCKNQSR